MTSEEWAREALEFCRKTIGKILTGQPLTQTETYLGANLSDQMGGLPRPEYVEWGTDAMPIVVNRQNELTPEEIIAQADMPCEACTCLESMHSYGPPMHNSSDGLPQFFGCFGEGESYAPYDTNHDYPNPICECKGFE